MQEIIINSNFDGGSIDVVSINDNKNIQLRIRKDTCSTFAQWFYFQVNINNLQQLTFIIDEINKTSYPQGWDGYNVCYSYCNNKWQRLVNTRVENNKLIFTIEPQFSIIYFAYFEPYSHLKHSKLIAMANMSNLVTHNVIGSTKDNRNIDLLIVGNPQAKKKVWIIARQHPGETMAEWFMEGLINKLLDKHDSTSKKLLQNIVFYLVPNMNPDGSVHGNLRVNSLGVNLNREWNSPSIDKSPEVYFVREKILKVGVDMFFDIHGDESIPYVFTAGCQDNQSFSKKQQQMEKKFTNILELLNLDFQTKIGYEANEFGSEVLTMATNWVGDKFDCLALTLEMPFKDNKNLPDMVCGWNSDRSIKLGESFITAISMFETVNKHLM